MTTKPTKRTLLATYCEQAEKTGINPTAPITPQGMNEILNYLDLANLVVNKPAMPEAWTVAITAWCENHGRPPITFQNAMAAAIEISASDNPPSFMKPTDLCKSLETLYRNNLKKALGTHRRILIPDELTGHTPREELAYRNTWVRVARLTGNSQQAHVEALKQLGIQPKPKKTLEKRETRPYLDAIASQLGINN